MSKELDLITNALTYAIEIFEDNELEVSNDMFKALNTLEKMKGN